LAKAYEIKVRCLNREHVGEHSLELRGNTVGTHWERGKNEKIKTLFAPSNLKGIEERHLGPSIG
jgi:hypothetical protein